jgi:hypothetical protein
MSDGPSGVLETGECRASREGSSGELCRRGNIPFTPARNTG